MTIVLSTWLLATLMHGVIIGAVALVAVPHLSRRPNIRVVLWRIALIAPLLTAAVSMAVTRNATTGTIDIATPLRPHLPPAWRREEVRILVDRRSGGPLVRQTGVDDPLAQALALLISVGAALSGAVGVGLFFRRRRDAMAALGLRDPLPAVAIALSPRSSPTRTIRFSGSPRLVSPIALSREEICLPLPAFGSLSPAEQESVLLHEVAHIERGDPLWLGVAQVAVALAPWQPLGRRLLRALRHDTELAADDRALARGAEPRALVSALARFSGIFEREGALSGVAFARGDSAILERGQRILGSRDGRMDSKRHAVTIGKVSAWLLIASAGIALVALPLPTPVDRKAVPWPPPGGELRGTPSTLLGREETIVTRVEHPVTAPTPRPAQ